MFAEFCVGFCYYFRGNQESIIQVYITSRTGSHNCSEQWKPMSQNACFIPSYSYLSRWFCDVLYLTQFPRTLFSFRFSSQDQFVLLEFFVEVASLGLAPGERPKTSEVVLTCCLVVYDYICLYRFQSVCAYIINMYTVYKQVYSSTQMYGHCNVKYIYMCVVFASFSQTKH